MSGSRTPIQSKLSIWRVKGCRTDFYNPMKLRMLAFISHRTKLWLIWSSTLTVAFGLMFVVYERAPPNTFDPFCTYRLAYRLNVTIEIGEKQYSSEVVSQLSQSRKWVEPINSAGCRQTLGTTVPFRLRDNRLVLIHSYICPKALNALADTGKEYRSDDFVQAMREHRKADLTSLCVGVSRNRPASYSRSSYDGFIVDNADNPKRWRGFNFESADMKEYIRIESAVAEAMDISPEDQLDKVAPEILKTKFTYDNWSASPEALLPFFRRYLPSKQFTYTAEEEWPRSD
jgi:hypothetical protein